MNQVLRLLLVVALAFLSEASATKIEDVTVGRFFAYSAIQNMIAAKDANRLQTLFKWSDPQLAISSDPELNLLAGSINVTLSRDFVLLINERAMSLSYDTPFIRAFGQDKDVLSITPPLFPAGRIDESTPCVGKTANTKFRFRSYVNSGSSTNYYYYRIMKVVSTGDEIMYDSGTRAMSEAPISEAVNEMKNYCLEPTIPYRWVYNYINDEMLSNEPWRDNRAADKAFAEFALLVLADIQKNPTIAGITLSGGLNPDALCTVDTCKGTSFPLGDTTTDPTAPPTSTSPACTKNDGTTSGNPYDCAPESSETNCKIIDVFCAFKKAAIPSDQFLNEKMPTLFTRELNMPTQVTDKIEVEVPLFGQKFSVGFTFTGLMMNDTFKGIITLMAAYGAFFWLLRMFGIPNMLENTAGSGEIAETVRKAGRITAKGREMRQAQTRTVTVTRERGMVKRK